MTREPRRGAGSRASRAQPRSRTHERPSARSPGGVPRRWTLIDQLESGGRRYILVRENAPAPRPPAPLSARERQVSALAALGRSNKWIAHELGLAHSTVRVLLARATAKLGVPSRAALVARVQAQDAPPAPRRPASERTPPR